MTTPSTHRFRKRTTSAPAIVMVLAIILLCGIPGTILVKGAYAVLFGEESRVLDVAMTESGLIYYTLETTEGGASTGEQSLWRLRDDEIEPELVSKPAERSCEGMYRDYSHWQTTGPDSVAVTVTCTSRETRLELWEYGMELARVQLIDTDAIVTGELCQRTGNALQ